MFQFLTDLKTDVEASRQSHTLITAMGCSRPREANSLEQDGAQIQPASSAAAA